VSGIVIYNSVSEKSYNASEGHRLWSQGFLFDNFIDKNTNVSLSNPVLGLYNRGDYGSGHGWAAVHSVAWNCNVGNSRIIIQKPPTAQNYAIGCTGIVTGDGPFSHPEGYIEGTNVAGLIPSSLYKAQLAERLSDIAKVDRSVVVRAGWNLLSLSLNMDENSSEKLFPSAISSPFIFNGTYNIADTLLNGSGFWIKFPSADTFVYHGSQILTDTINLKPGWNLIGSISIPVDTSMIVINPLGIVVPQYYLYDGSSYHSTDTIQPGVGYWVKANGNGSLILSGTIQKKSSNPSIILRESIQSDSSLRSKRLFGKTSTP
jgi:hypothetical protein